MLRNIFVLILTLIFFQNCSSQSYPSTVNVQEIKEDIFLITENIRFTCNILAVTSKDGILLMDAGFNDGSNDLYRTIQSLNKGPVKYIINSHGHGDHTGANCLFAAKAVVISHRKCEDSRNPKTIVLDNEYEFIFGNKTIQCMSFVDGHSPCDIMVSIPESNVVYLGDIFLSESFPLIDIGSGANAQTMVDNLKVILSKLREDVLIIPGHGKAASYHDLTNYIEMLETTIDLVRSAKKSGKQLQEIKDENILDNWSEWGRFFSFITKETWIDQIYNSY